MRNRLGTLLACALILTAAPMLVSCNTAGNTTRDVVSSPAMQMADDTIVKHAKIGAEFQPELLAPIASFQQSIDEGNAEGAYLLWPQIEQAALAGIDARQAAGELGPGSADSFRETVARFGSLLTRHVTRLGGTDPS